MFCCRLSGLIYSVAQNLWKLNIYLIFFICDPPSFPCFVCLSQTAQVDEVFEFPTATSCVKR
jgi:hypothetical protein